MNTLEKLLNADINNAGKLEEGKFKSRKLAKILGEDETVEITIRELSEDRIAGYFAMLQKVNNDDVLENMRINSLICSDSIIEPNVKDPALLEHFGVSTPDELVKKVFGLEANMIAGKTIELSGITGDAEETIKNS